ncbi:MAG: hypothetical protein QMD77_03835 [Patescibacteria group bacterium]|nr:hypothetical protein [Patescibacteria group bacterium]
MNKSEVPTQQENQPEKIEDLQQKVELLKQEIEKFEELLVFQGKPTKEDFKQAADDVQKAMGDLNFAINITRRDYEQNK